MNNEKSSNPNDVPDKVKVHLGDLGPLLALSAKNNGRTLSEEIRARLKQSVESDNSQNTQTNKLGK